MSKADQVKAMVGAVLDEYKQIDILVNNAGITTHTGRLDGFGAEDIEQCMAVNVTGMLNCIQAVTPHMKSRCYGKIINVASFRAYATRYSSPYDISKAAALALTVEVASELAPFNINVVSVSPGAVATDMNREKLLSDAEKLREFEAKIPLGRIAQRKILPTSSVFSPPTAPNTSPAPISSSPAAKSSAGKGPSD